MLNCPQISKVFPTALSCTACLIVAVGCSAQLDNPGTLESSQIRRTTSSASLDRHLISDKDRNLDCRRITGRMQVRILQIRDRLEPTGGSFSGIVKSAFAAGNDLLSVQAVNSGDYSLQARTTNDVAILSAYNRLLAEKNCATFDLEAELQPKPIKHTPMPISHN